MQYSVEVQKLFLEFIVQDPVLYTRVSNIYNPENWDKTLRKASSFIKQHAELYNTIPDRSQIQAVGGVNLQKIDDINDGHKEWFLTEFENFTRRQELERAILQAADMLQKGEYDPVEKLIKDAVQIGLAKDLGTNYFSDPRTRLERMRDNNGKVSTGWKHLDYKLFGGFAPGELQIFCANSGGGKSLFLANLACNWTLMGLSGAYITLELSEDLCALRVDAMLTGMSTKDVFKELDTVEVQIANIGRKAGSLFIKYMSAQSTVNDIRAYVKELEISTGKKIDFLLVDYLDLLMPVSVKVDPSNLFVKDKYVSEELRNLSKELNTLTVSASQFNRSGVEETEFDHANIAGGKSKIDTADNVFGIYTSRSMRERSRYQLQMLKTRSSNGVGQKVDLAYNVDTLRITDCEQEENTGQAAPPGGIMNRLKTSGNVKPPGQITTVNNAKLKNMLEGLKNSGE